MLENRESASYSHLFLIGRLCVFLPKVSRCSCKFMFAFFIGFDIGITLRLEHEPDLVTFESPDDNLAHIGLKLMMC